MSHLEYYENIMQEKTKEMDFRAFLLYVCSWVPCMFYKRNSLIWVYPETDRIGNLVSVKEFGTNEPKAKEYRPERSFFENFSLFRLTTDLPAIRQFPPTENSEYAEASGAWVKNCYLDFWAYMDCENILYTYEAKEKCTNVYNSVMVWDRSENIYQSNSILNGFNIFYSRFIYESSDIWFSSNLVGCKECILCDGLENASYQIQNKPYEKEEYFEKKKDLLGRKWLYIGLYENVSKIGVNMLSENVVGNFSIKSTSLENGYNNYNIHDGKNVILAGCVNGNHYMYNVAVSGAPQGNHYYNVLNSGWGDHMYCSEVVTGSKLYYSYHCFECHHCLGCIWLKNKSYYILNKQYTKEEWEVFAEKIFASMEADGTLGEFFPASMNPFYFNDTLAYLIDESFTKEEVIQEWYLWREDPIKVDVPEWLEVVRRSDLNRFQGFRLSPLSKEGADWKEAGDLASGSLEQNPQSPPSSSTAPLQKEPTWYIDPEIMNVVIVDEKWNYYRIVKMEYDFLMKHALPLPTMHWLDRMRSGFCF